MENENQRYEQETTEQGVYGYTGNPFEQMDEGLCKKCRRRTIDRSENPDSVLCKECREELIKLKIPPVFYVAGVLVLLLIIFTIIPSFRGFTNLYSYNSAQNVSDEGYVITVMDNLVSILQENPDNMDVAIELADVAMEHSYYDYAAYAIDNFLVGEEVSDKVYYRINRYIDELDIYYETIELSEGIWDELYADWEEDDDPYAILNTYCEKISEYIGNSKYDQALLYYYLGNMAEDEEQRNAYLEECVAINPCYYDAQAQIAVYYRRQGNLGKAREILEAVYGKNKEVYSILRAYATLELAEGNLEEGLSYARRAYDIYPEGDYVVDTYAVALAANDRIEEARELVREYEDNDYYFDDEFYDFFDGNITLEDYYIGE